MTIVNNGAVSQRRRIQSENWTLRIPFLNFKMNCKELKHSSEVSTPINSNNYNIYWIRHVKYNIQKSTESTKWFFINVGTYNLENQAPHGQTKAPSHPLFCVPCVLIFDKKRT